MEYTTMEGDAIFNPQAAHPFAVPSWVFPGTVAENAAFLDGRVAEVGVCCFETRACLEWGEKDLPGSLARLDLKWHVHLPADLPWNKEGSAADAALCLMNRLDYLGPSKAVLHLPKASPENTAEFLRHFVERWSTGGYSPDMLLLENTAGQPLYNLESLIISLGCGVCLDFGHLLRYDQRALLERPDLLSRVRLTHWSAPGGGDRHQPLTALTPEEKILARRVAGLTGTALPMLEVFDWVGIEASRPVLRALYAGPETFWR